MYHCCVNQGNILFKNEHIFYVHGESEAVLADFLQVFEGAGRILADDELPGHALDIGADGLGHQPQ